MLSAADYFSRKSSSRAYRKSMGLGVLSITISLKINKTYFTHTFSEEHSIQLFLFWILFCALLSFGDTLVPQIKFSICRLWWENLKWVRGDRFCYLANRVRDRQFLSIPTPWPPPWMLAPLKGAQVIHGAEGWSWRALRGVLTEFWPVEFWPLRFEALAKNTPTVKLWKPGENHGFEWLHVVFMMFVGRQRSLGMWRVLLHPRREAPKWALNDPVRKKYFGVLSAGWWASLALLCMRCGVSMTFTLSWCFRATVDFQRHLLTWVVVATRHHVTGSPRCVLS